MCTEHEQPVFYCCIVCAFALAAGVTDCCALVRLLPISKALQACMSTLRLQLHAWLSQLSPSFCLYDYALSLRTLGEVLFWVDSQRGRRRNDTPLHMDVCNVKLLSPC